MTTNIVQVDGQKIYEIVKGKGLSLSGASREMGAGESYLSGVTQSGRMNPSYLKLFCLTFDADESDIISSQTRIFSGSRNFVPINSEKCRKLIYKNGYTFKEICDKLGYENSWLSNTLSRGTMHINTLKRFAKLMNTSWQSLILDEPIIIENAEITREISEPEPLIENEKQDVKPDGICDESLIKCFYNLATSMEAALTNFRQDLLALETMKGELQ